MKVNYDEINNSIIEEIHNRYNMTGKRVLDIGCGTRGMVRLIAEKYNPEYINGIDLGIQTEQGVNFKVQSGDARRIPFDDNTFDLVYSISTFEHINRIEETLAEVRRVLKPYGKFFAVFAPVWTSVCGYHAYSNKSAFSERAIKRGDDKDEEIIYAIPPWGHLFMSPEEMAQHLRTQGIDEHRIDVINRFIYDDDGINRYPASTIKNWIMNCNMIVRDYQERVTFSRNWALDKNGPSELTPDIIKKLSNTKYQLNEIGIVYMKFELEKYEAFPS